jgi:hypothetical protein
LRYEDLRDNYDATLDKIREHYDFERLHHPYRVITQYKGTYTAGYFKKPILIGSREQEQIWKRIDGDQEAELGYFAP